jgi:hypothetical protein
VWYTIVVVRASNLPPAASSDVTPHPENYYLHAVNEQGDPVFPNQKEIDGYIMYGMQYDVDGSRLVALCINKNVGRV